MRATTVKTITTGLAVAALSRRSRDGAGAPRRGRSGRRRQPGRRRAGPPLGRDDARSGDDKGGKRSRTRESRSRREVRVSGRCSGRSSAKLKAKQRDGRLEVELEVDENRVGSVWQVRLKHDGDTFARALARTKAPSGSYDVERKIRDRKGKHAITAKASGPRRRDVLGLALDLTAPPGAVVGHAPARQASAAAASSRRSSPQNSSSPTATVGTPVTPSAIAASVSARSRCLTSSPVSASASA